MTFSISRFLAILMKEFIQMRRDRMTFAMNRWADHCGRPGCRVDGRAGWMLIDRWPWCRCLSRPCRHAGARRRAGCRASGDIGVRQPGRCRWGVTSLGVMPDTDPVIDDAALVDFLMRRARDTAIVHIHPSLRSPRNLRARRWLKSACSRRPVRWLSQWPFAGR